MLSAQNTFTRQIPAGGTGVFQNSTLGQGDANGPEIDPALSGDQDGGNDNSGAVAVNRTIAKGAGKGAKANGSGRAKSNPEVSLSFDGLNLFQERFADNGNQFTVEPPDQGLCAGNGFVLESTNDVLRVYNGDGSAASGVVSLNKFYGYASAINRTVKPPTYGPSITDPSCIFDRESQRWFHVVLTLDRVGTTAALAGTNHLDLAVSQTPNPLGAWTIYRIPVQNDGSQGTPNHHCALQFCLGDYPHIGADANGIYLTTNEFSLFGAGFYGAQIYALSKEALVNGASGVRVVEYNTGDPSTPSATGLPGFAVWPAVSANGSAGDDGGSEYLLSSLAVFQANNTDSRLQLWSLLDTKALNGGGVPTLTSSVVNTEPYAVPGFARQPGVGTNGVGAAPGGGNVNYPYGQTLGATIGPLAANDSRMQQVYFANGKLWSSLGTGVAYEGGGSSAGLAYFVLQPQNQGGNPTARVVQQGYVADPDVDYTYGTAAATESGRGTLSFTATGPENYPSVGYTSLDAKIGAGAVHLAAPGVGAQDGFTEYTRRPRWGDYGAAAVDGNAIWFAQEYIGQSCTLAQYTADSTCGQTRAPLGNWDTRIVKATF